jgi:hypothetical protein
VRVRGSSGPSTNADVKLPNEGRGPHFFATMNASHALAANVHRFMLWLHPE